jgi:hypothetical protein
MGFVLLILIEESGSSENAQRSAMPLCGNLKAGFTIRALAGCVTPNVQWKTAHARLARWLVRRNPVTAGRWRKTWRRQVLVIFLYLFL